MLCLFREGRFKKGEKHLTRAHFRKDVLKDPGDLQKLPDDLAL